MPHDSHYVDSNGKSWSIRELLESPRPRKLRKIPVDYLWSCWACKRRWGDSLPSPARLLGSPIFLNALSSQRLKVSFEDTVEAHTARIINFVRLYRDGNGLPPLVIGPDGNFWDGVHRLSALYTMGVCEVDVADFTINGSYGSDECGTLDLVFDSTWIDDGREAVRRLLEEGKPYRHLFLPQVLRSKMADDILAEYPDLPWRLSETDFYEQYEITLLDCQQPIGESLRALREVVLSYRFAKRLSSITGFPSLRVSDIACHRSTSGQQIGIHTDYSDNREVCRLTLHFNPHWRVEDGGLFVTFAGPEIDSAVATYPPEHNSAILFKISEHSYHAVTPVDSNRERYSMVIAMTAA